MGKKQNIIHINGKRYDAHTGAPLDHVVSKSASSPVVKPIAVKHAPADKSTVNVKAAVHHKSHSSGRQPAKPAARHKQQRSTTLMRQAVHKPGIALKRHVKVQNDISALVEQPEARIAPKLSFGAPDPKRLEHATRIKRSQLIMHFNPNQPDYSTQKITVKINRPAEQQPEPKPVPRQAAPDIDDIFERAIQNATSHLEPTPKAAKKHRIHIRRKHARV